MGAIFAFKAKKYEKKETVYARFSDDEIIELWEVS
jgi:hypothetical protein